MLCWLHTLCNVKKTEPDCGAAGSCVEAKTCTRWKQTLCATIEMSAKRKASAANIFKTQRFVKNQGWVRVGNML